MCSLIWLICRPSGVPIENQRGQGGGLRLFWNRVIKIVGTLNWFPIVCSDKFVGIIVPTMIVGTPNGGFLLAVHTNLSKQTTIYNSATGRIKIAAAVGF